MFLVSSSNSECLMRCLVFATDPHEISTIIMPILQRRRLRYKEVKKLAGGSVTGAKEAKVESRQPDYRARSSSSYNILPVPHEVHHGVRKMKRETPPRPTQLMPN